jgi:hypothetical protein
MPTENMIVSKSPTDHLASAARPSLALKGNSRIRVYPVFIHNHNMWGAAIPWSKVRHRLG